MAVMRRNNGVFIYFRPFKTEKVGIRMADGVGKSEARRIEGAILHACRTGDYRNLDPVSREVCIRMFGNRSWELPEDLRGKPEPKHELTLWKACELLLKYPDVKDSPSRWRHEITLAHMVSYFGKDMAIKDLWIPELKGYRSQRLSDGAKPATVNRELVTLSRLFSVLIECQLVSVNPCRLLKQLSERAGQRQVYISQEDFLRILEVCRDWYKPIMQVAYYSGMRRREILELRRQNVKLAQRMIFLAPETTKEHDFKRVPIRLELMPVFEQATKITTIGDDHVFLMNDEKGIRPVNIEACKNPWRRQIAELGFEQAPRFHDLRHTWRANARRSGMDPVIAESILGHWHRERTVNERYGRLSNDELLKAVDAMRFDFGPTEIVVSGGG